MSGRCRGSELQEWPARRWMVAAAAAVTTAMLIGLPTEMVANRWFDRMTPVRVWDRPVWLMTSVLAGLLIATYVAPGASGNDGDPAGTDGDPAGTDGDPAGTDGDRSARAGGFGGALAFFAVGCPVCNKLVVLALGTSGALTWFEPAQPILALASLVLLGAALRARLRGERACAVPLERSRSGAAAR